MSHSQGAGANALAQDIRAFSGRLKRCLREQSDIGDLKPSQVAVIQRLEAGGPTTTSGLAQAEGMRSQSMSVVVAALEAAGLVAGAPDPADGRQKILSLTDTCRDWLLQGRAQRQDWLSRTIGSRLTAAEQDELAAAMRLLKRLVEP